MKEIKATPTGNGVIVKEARVFEATREDIRRKIEGLEYHRRSLIAQSAEIKSQYDSVTAELKEYKRIYEANFPAENTDFVEVKDNE